MLVQKNVLIYLLTLIAVIGVGAAHADTKTDAKSDAKSDFEFVATVNGSAITQGLLNLNI